MVGPSISTSCAVCCGPTTKLVAVNYPNNPTGHVPDEATSASWPGLCNERGIRLFCDEVYRGIELDPERTLPQAADLSERAMALNVASKSYGLPGLRIGWLASRDRALLERIEKRKHYTTICNAGADGVPHGDRAGGAGSASGSATAASSPPTSPLFQAFFDRHADLFDFAPPMGGCVCYVRYAGGDVEDFWRQRLLNAEGVLVLPASIYCSENAATPADYFRVGLGRVGLDAGIEAFERFVREQ